MFVLALCSSSSSQMDRTDIKGIFGAYMLSCFKAFLGTRARNAQWYSVHHYTILVHLTTRCGWWPSTFMSRMLNAVVTNENAPFHLLTQNCLVQNHNFLGICGSSSSINFCHANWNTYPEDAFLGRHAHHIFNDEVTSCYYNVIVKRCNKTFFVELCCMMIYHLSQNCKCTLGGWKIWSSQQKVLAKDIFHGASS